MTTAGLLVDAAEPSICLRDSCSNANELKIATDCSDNSFYVFPFKCSSSLANRSLNTDFIIH